MSGRGKIGVDDPARAEDMCKRFKAGETLQSIGSSYQISRERVRQIIKKFGGLVGSDGGAMLGAKIRKNKRLAAMDAKSLEKYGCTFAQHKMLLHMGASLPHDRTPCGAFGNQRSNARKRGIEWNLKLWEWWCIWERSGKWEQRGRGAGYVMARHNDSGPYSVDNVKIITGVENSSEAPKKKKHDLPLGVSIRSRGSHVSYSCSRMVAGKKIQRYGFKTPAEAHNAYLSIGGQ